MSRAPSQRDLEAAGADAGALLDAHEWEIERAIPMARDADARAGLVEDLRALRGLRERWFSSGVAGEVEA